MAAPVPLRPDFDAKALRALAKGSRDPVQTRRLLALSVIATSGALGGGRSRRSWASDSAGLGPGVQRRWAGWAAGKAPGADRL